MNSGDFLLRMLNPAVRPDGRTGPVANVAPAAGAPEAPFEQRDFASLLAQAREVASAAEPAAEAELGAKAAPPASPLAELSQIDRIENTTLRNLISRL